MKTSVKAAANAAQRQDAKHRAAVAKGAPLVTGTLDSFVNLAHKLGIGADNPLSGGTYGYNPITRNRNLLEWIHRGSWLGGVAIDIVADDMTRAGISYKSELDPEDATELDSQASALGIWDRLNEGIKWGRLYGGSITVLLIDGQDPRTPLRLETVGKDQFKGLLVLDRWFVEPSLEDLVTELGPDLGLPKYYRVSSNAPALRNTAIHYSRIVLRHIGVQLPYQQALTENLWGVSVLERLYDRMIGFDSASTGIAQLVFKSYLRTLKVKDLRQVVAAGGKAMDGLQSYADIMRRFQSIEGLTMIDGEDELEVQSTSAFTGVSSAIEKLGEQVSGALQVPLARLFGQAPGGLNSDGDSQMRNYYDGINQKQNSQMKVGVIKTWRCMAQSCGQKLPDEFDIEFASLWQLDGVQKSTVAKSTSDAISGQFEKGIIGRQTALRELRNSSRTTGIFSSITRQMIDEADDEVLPPAAEMAMGQEHDENMAELGNKHEKNMAELSHKQGKEMASVNNKAKADLAKTAAKAKGGANGPNGTKKPVGGSQPRRKLL